MFFFGFGLCIYGRFYFQIIMIDLIDRGADVHTYSTYSYISPYYVLVLSVSYLVTFIENGDRVNG
jgi:hypothetical protein